MKFSKSLIIAILITVIMTVLWLKTEFELPVKYYNCNAAHTDCFIMARFKDMNSCKMAEEKASWYCDSVSTPGKAVCDTAKKSTISATYCSD